MLPRLAELAETGADFLILVKPQFELERKDVSRGGIVREPALHQRAIERVRAAAVAGPEVAGVLPSRVTGAEGNQEFFLHARRRDECSVTNCMPATPAALRDRMRAALRASINEHNDPFGRWA